MLKISFLTLLSIIPSIAFGADTLLENVQQLRISQGASKALPYLNEMVQKAPQNGAYHFERGVALAETGQCRSANTSFSKAQNIIQNDFILKAWEDSLNRNCFDFQKFEKRFSLGFIWDQNYNNATEQDTVVIQGLTYTLSDDAKAQERYGILLSGGYTYNHSLGWGEAISLGIDSSLLLLNEAEDNRFTLTPEITYKKRFDNSSYEFGPFLTYQYSEKGLEAESYGLSYNSIHKLSPKTTLHTQARFTSTDDKTPADSGDDITLGFQIQNKVNQNSRYSIGISFLQQNRDNTYDSLKSVSLTTSYSGIINENYGYELGANYTLRNAEGLNPIFQETRKDNVTKVYAAIKLNNIKTPVGKPYLGLTYTNSKSTIVLNDYEKTSINFGFLKSF